MLARALRACFDAGARPAEPGEFTFRAYVAGKLDLTRAEGVSATVAAESDGQLRAAASLREGRLARATAELVDRLGTLLALTEAGIDFVDQEDVVPITPAALLDGVDGLRRALAALRRRSRPWAEATALPRVVLVGPPSSGKSTLFNALLGRPRAVIDASPGTTRDALAEPLTLPGTPPREVLLIDVAGLDTAAAPLDRAAQAAARRELGRADLLLVFDERSTASTSIEPPAGTPRLALRSKHDLRDTPPPDGVRSVSGVTGYGLDALREAIASALTAPPPDAVSGDALAVLPRHERALADADAALHDALALLAPQRDAAALADVELVAAGLRAALDALAELGGGLSPDDVIGRVFATFCVGK